MENLISFCLSFVIGYLISPALLTILEVLGSVLRRWLKRSNGGS